MPTLYIGSQPFEFIQGRENAPGVASRAVGDLVRYVALFQDLFKGVPHDFGEFGGRHG
jgi:hypothetical protein